jgi:acyl-CoA synthetase (AMP-forming)/AMP-acid ligase II
VSLLYQCLRAQVAAHPSAVAIEDDSRAWTYAEFDAAITLWHERLAQGDFERGMAFGWLGANSVAMLAALFACAQRGVRFVPMNWRLARPELMVPDAARRPGRLACRCGLRGPGWRRAAGAAARHAARRPAAGLHLGHHW